LFSSKEGKGKIDKVMWGETLGQKRKKRISPSSAVEKKKEKT